MVLLVLDVLGWLGGVMIAGGYMLVSVRRIAADSALFQALNAVGAAMLGAACVAQGSLPSAVLNAVWLSVGIRALVSEGVRRRATAAPSARQANFCDAA